MSHKVTRLEHPWPAVVLHWVHLLSFFALLGTGLAIHAHANWFGNVGFERQTHFIAMFFFILTTVARIYWAFFGAGSAGAGELTRRPDWRFFGLSGADWKAIPSWIAYYLFMRKTHPPVDKYNPLQRLTYGVLFPLGILVMALTGFCLFQPTAEAMGGLTVLLGGLNGARLIHYLSMWAMISLFIVHLYLVIVEDPVQASTMLFRNVPKGMRTTGDYAESGATAAKAAEQKA